MAPPIGPRDDDYQPTHKEIWERAEALQWMRNMEWSWEVIDSVMYDDTPDLKTLRTIVWKHGPTKALKIIQKFMD